MTSWRTTTHALPSPPLDPGAIADEKPTHRAESSRPVERSPVRLAALVLAGVPVLSCAARRPSRAASEGGRFSRPCELGRSWAYPGCV